MNEKEVHMTFDQVKVGLEKSIQKEITKEDTALNFGSGELKELLASPTLAALMIEAAINTVDKELPDGYISAGQFIEFTHVNPTVEGMTVTVTAKVIEVKDTKVVLEINALDELGLVGTARHVRYIVQYDTFIKKAKERCKAVENQDR